MNIYKKKIYNHIIPLIGGVFINKLNIPILYYHNVVPDGQGYTFMHTEISVFKKQMRYLKEKGYKTYIFEEIPREVKKTEGSNQEVIITFDDGFLSNYSKVFPFLKELGLNFNVFLTAGYLEDKKENYLNWEMVSEMSASKTVGFGAHTYSHIDSRKIDETNYYKEIELTNQLIKEHTKKDVNDFCFPYGYYDEKTISYFTKKRAYKRLYTIDYMKPRSINECEVIGRIPISNDYDIRVFKKHLQGYYDIMYYYIIYKRFLRKKRNNWSL